MSSKKLSWLFEEEIFSLFSGVVFNSPISGVLISPPVMDEKIVALPPDFVGYQKRDNSVSVGIGIDFDLWERSSELDRLGLLAGNVHISLDKIQSRYLVADYRKKLHLMVDEARAQMALKLQH